MAVSSNQGFSSSYRLFHGWCLIIDTLLCGHAVLAVGCDQDTAIQKLQGNVFDCDVLTGKFVYSEDIRELFEKVKTINGTLHYHNTNGQKLEVSDLNFISDQDEPLMTIASNPNLMNIRPLLTMNFKEKKDKQYVKFLDNPSLCDTHPMRDIIREKVQNYDIFFISDCLTACAGGRVDKKYLSKFPEYCSTIKGDLIIAGRNGSDDLTKLEQVITILGSLIVANNTNITDLYFLRYLRHIGKHSSNDPVIVLTNNSDLTELALERLETLEAAEDTPVLVVVQYVEGQEILDLGMLVSMSGQRVEISHVNHNGDTNEIEEHENNTWKAFLVIGCGCLLLILIGVIAFVVVRRKDKKPAPSNETASLPSLPTQSRTNTPTQR